VAETSEQIKEHIRVLSDFEQLYRGFIGAISRLRRTGNCPLTTKQLNEMRREVLKAAPRADRAAAASGYSLEIYHPPMLGGRLKSDTLSAQVLDFEDPGFDFEDDGLDIPRQILDTLPVQISSLEMMLEEAEKRRPTRAERRAAKRQEYPASPQEPKKEATPQKLLEHPVGKTPDKGRPWHENPWVVGIGVTVIGGLVVVGILGLVGLLG
jgi:hypothetical protein